MTFSLLSIGGGVRCEFAAVVYSVILLIPVIPEVLGADPRFPHTHAHSQLWETTDTSLRFAFVPPWS